jgi:hypothetical protein
MATTKEFRFTITGVIYAKSKADAEELAEEMAHMDGAICDPVIVEPLIKFPDLSTEIKFSQSLVDKFYAEFKDKKSMRLGQAFYNFFNMHRMSDQSQLGKLYEMGSDEARAWIAAHTSKEN